MKTMINIKADRDVKIKAQKVAKKVGMPLSKVIFAYLRDFVRREIVHFPLRDSLALGKFKGVHKPAVQRRLGRIHKDIAAETLQVLHSADEMDTY